MLVSIHCVGHAQDVVCPTPLTGGALLRALGQPVAILANIQPLKDGQLHRTFRRVTPEDDFHVLDLSTYSEVYTPERRFFGRIEATQLPQTHAGVPQEPVPQEGLRPARALERTGLLRILTLHAVYEKLYHTLPWPSPLPRPEQVTVQWNRRFTRTLARCWWRLQIIEVSAIYQDAHLAQNLEYLMTHEAAHFLWHGHPPAFKAFLRSVGVPEMYIHRTNRPVPEVARAIAAKRYRAPARPHITVLGCG